MKNSRKFLNGLFFNIGVLAILEIGLNLFLGKSEVTLSNFIWHVLVLGICLTLVFTIIRSYKLGSKSN